MFYLAVFFVLDITAIPTQSLNSFTQETNLEADFLLTVSKFIELFFLLATQGGWT